MRFLSERENFIPPVAKLCQSDLVRFFVAVVAVLLGLGVLAPPAAAGPSICDLPDCTPGIRAHMILGTPCDSTTYYVFATADYYVSFATQPGRLMFCGSPRRYEPRWFRSPPMAGVKAENSDCVDYPEYYVAQAPDGLFLVCNAHDGRQVWERGDT
jgi:hypothetical protein